MRTHVEFRSSKFPPYDGEDDEVNPGLFGRRLAEYLKERLAERGVASGQVYAEDWGWAIPIEETSCPIFHTRSE